MQLLVGTDAGTGGGVWGGDSALWLHRTGVVWGQGHTQEHTGRYTQMLHPPFSDLPLKKCPNCAGKIPLGGGWKVELRTRSFSVLHAADNSCLAAATAGKSKSKALTPKKILVECRKDFVLCVIFLVGGCAWVGCCSVVPADLPKRVCETAGCLLRLCKPAFLFSLSLAELLSVVIMVGAWRQLMW